MNKLITVFTCSIFTLSIYAISITDVNLHVENSRYHNNHFVSCVTDLFQDLDDYKNLKILRINDGHLENQIGFSEKASMQIIFRDALTRKAVAKSFIFRSTDEQNGWVVYRDSMSVYVYTSEIEPVVTVRDLKNYSEFKLDISECENI